MKRTVMGLTIEILSAAATNYKTWSDISDLVELVEEDGSENKINDAIYSRLHDGDRSIEDLINLSLDLLEVPDDTTFTEEEGSEYYYTRDWAIDLFYDAALGKDFHPIAYADVVTTLVKSETPVSYLRIREMYEDNKSNFVYV